jgi:antitoxin (DNA-binding transcriptional repressor) of toxin-antitoxin stability system
MVIYGTAMTISVTEFKAHCLEILRTLERRGGVVEIERRGKVVARLVPVAGDGSLQNRPWERLRGSGRLLATPDESVLAPDDFVATR